MKRSSTIKETKLIFIFFIVLTIVNLSCSKEIIKIESSEKLNSIILNNKFESVILAVKTAYYNIDYRGGTIKRSTIDTVNNARSLKFIISSGFFQKSQEFTINNKSIPIWTDFEIYVNELSDKKVQVIVLAKNVRLEIGKKVLPSLPHFGDNPKFKEISRPIYEEYLLLMKIEEILKK